MLDFLGEFVLKTLFGLTGHALFWCVSLGRWETMDKHDDAAMIAGLLFWAAVGVGLWLALR